MKKCLLMISRKLPSAAEMYVAGQEEAEANEIQEELVSVEAAQHRQANPLLSDVVSKGCVYNGFAGAFSIIASGTEPRLLTDAYEQATDMDGAPKTLSREALIFAGQHANQAYEQALELAVAQTEAYS